MVIINPKLDAIKKSALDAIKKSAKEGRESAQYQLAQHHIGLREYAEAVYWLQKASKQGFTLATDQLQEVIKYGLKRK